ncbi:hypothetical protein [Rehaibacterium terrae]|jgi:hypothetical protein|uniref:Uncharacterized protein n=1 Tax=Rehaibacterium terrae TaxID=1341696 RepID=A0A7W7V712_9GAMM|nr:hypothetical protein [Rehaibacterium terrae]MBB5014323.1 hypothetical protein [Rehaibacterium terrae]
MKSAIDNPTRAPACRPSTKFASVLCCLFGGALAAGAAGAHSSGSDALPKHCGVVAAAKPGGSLPPACRQDEVARQLDMLRRAVSPFFSFDTAVAAGWDVPLSGCVESPMGGMGYHYGKLDQLGNGTLSLLRPEALLYAPTADGSMEFLGVEYIIPAPLWPHAEPPQFLGQHLHYNPHQDIWALHVWVGRDNPSGIFADWNPEVTCEFAQ